MFSFTKSASLAFVIRSTSVLGALVLLSACSHLFQGDKALKELEQEFRQVAVLPDAAQLRYDTSNKGAHGTVGADYRTDKTDEEILKHYDRELRRLNWSFKLEEPVRIWGVDYGGKQFFWCKGRYTATLETAGSQPGIPWTYSFGFSWGLFDECNK